MADLAYKSEELLSDMSNLLRWALNQFLILVSEIVISVIHF